MNTLFFRFGFVFEILGISLLLRQHLLLYHLLLFWSKCFKLFRSHTWRHHPWNYPASHFLQHIRIEYILLCQLLRWYWINSELLTACQFFWGSSWLLSWKIHTLACHELRNILLLNPSSFCYHQRFFDTFSTQRFHEMILVCFALWHHCTFDIISTPHNHLLLLMHLLTRYQLKYILLWHTF